MHDICTTELVAQIDSVAAIGQSPLGAFQGLVQELAVATEPALAALSHGKLLAGPTGTMRVVLSCWWL